MAVQSVWTEVEAQKFDQIGNKLVWDLLHKSMVFGIETDMTVVEENEAKLATWL